jgi:putative chitobiose transport system substrate-binding protein
LLEFALQFDFLRLDTSYRYTLTHFVPTQHVLTKEKQMSLKVTRRDFLRATTLLGAGALSGSLLSACAAPPAGAPAAQSGGEAAAENITIEWWTINLKNTFGEIMQGYIDSYQAEHPEVTINWVDVPGNEVAQKYATALSAGNAPDSANMYQLARFIELGAVLALDDYVPAEDQDAFGPFWDTGAIGGSHYAIPWYTSFARPSVVNGKLAKAAGVDFANPPKTWEEVFDVGRAGKDAWGPGVLPWVDCWTTRSWFFEEGLEILNEDYTAAAVNTPEWEAHINTILGLHEEQLLSLDAYACPDIRVSIDWFWQGLGAFSNSGTYILNRTENEVLEAGEYDIVPTLVGDANRIAADPQFFVIAKNSAHPDVATDFTMSIVRTDNFIRFAEAVSIAPTYLPALEHPFFTEPPAEEPATYQEALIRKAVEIGIADMQRVAMEPLSKPVSYWTTVYEEVWQQIANEELALVEGNLTAAEFLATWEAAINTAIAEAPPVSA